MHTQSCYIVILIHHRRPVAYGSAFMLGGRGSLWQVGCSLPRPGDFPRATDVLIAFLLTPLVL